MAENIWNKGKLTPIYYPVGKRENGEDRYIRAPFDLLKWQSTTSSTEDLYVLPLGFETIGAKDFTLAGQDERTRVEFGYYSPEPIVLQQHEGDGKSDTWKALHSFGPV